MFRREECGVHPLWQTAQDAARGTHSTLCLDCNMRPLRLLALSPQLNCVCVFPQWFGHIRELGLASEKGAFLRWPARLTHLRGHKVAEYSEETQKEVVGDIKRVVTSPKEEKKRVESKKVETTQAQPPRHSQGDVDEISQDKEWEIIRPMSDMTWKDIALATLRSYCARTDGSWIEDKDYSIVWHYEAVDPEYGRMQVCALPQCISLF